MDKKPTAADRPESVRALLAGESELPRRPSLGEEAADRLREMILTERYPAGAQLPEQELAAALGISRTPLRDALRILVSEGLVVHRGIRRTFHVADPSLDELADDLAVIGVLEGLAGELACRNASDDALAGIAALERRMRNEAGSLSALELFELDMAFHRGIVEASGNASLGQTHSAYNARLWRARFVSARTTSKRHDQQVMHRRIVTALLARDQNAAMQALRQHMANAVGNIRAALEARDRNAGKDG